MTRELAGRTALVTGAAKNIGRAIALALAEGGARVMCSALSNEAGLAETVALVRQAGGEAEAMLADVTDEAAVRALVEATTAGFGGLDILVNNAAVRTEVPFREMSLATFRAIMAVALEGPFLLSRAALPALERSPAAAIVNIGGLTAYTGARDRAHVVAAKAGLDGLTKALAHDLADAGITVNLVSPGMIQTQRGGSSAQNPHHHAAHGSLLGRRGTPEEVAAMVRHVAGPAGRYLTGQTFHVNGGAYLP
jgi:3-oxoacyl-[acyl-carrier protein] reductase